MVPDDAENTRDAVPGTRELLSAAATAVNVTRRTEAESQAQEYVVELSSASLNANNPAQVGSATLFVSEPNVIKI
jgi:hypothetical protein